MSALLLCDERVFRPAKPSVSRLVSRIVEVLHLFLSEICLFIPSNWPQRMLNGNKFLIALFFGQRSGCIALGIVWILLNGSWGFSLTKCLKLGVTMFKKALLACSVLALASSAALAAGSSGVVVSKDGRTVTALHGVPTIAQIIREPKAKAIFENIGYLYPNGLYFCCYGATISGPSSALGAEYWAAEAFTPSSSTSVSDVQVGVGYVEGTNSVNVGLYSDAGGVPGTSLYNKDITMTTNFGSCCGILDLKIKKGVSVTAGTQYWVVVSTDSKDTNLFGAWNYNSTDQINPVTEASYSNGAWSSYSGVPAFDMAVFSK